VLVTEALEQMLARQPGVPDLLDHFPRDVVALASYGLEIPITYRPNLTVQTARRYVQALGGDRRPDDIVIKDRRLFGWLHVGPPSNIIIVDAGLSPAVANYVVAHELGHFFADVLLVRERWLSTLPAWEEAIREAFDWRRSDGWLELRAVIAGLPPRPDEIMGRGDAERPETAEREDLANLIAREILAPWRIVAPLCMQRSGDGLPFLLRRTFGLPAQVAHDYCDDLRMALAPRRDVVDRLFGPLLGTDGFGAG
jgi:hypothetical protein